ncbi:MAG: 30S ribosomal protein S6 [Spirochaetaceae bacterium]|jgi:small subunit ribosomal protein S6|nr:30S ribosomal protein S6 [Spirochaetaceae bacterium]
MRQYELMIVLPAEEGPQQAGREQVQADLSAQGAEIEKTTEIGDRDLAYEIDKQHRGKYVLYNIKLDPAKVAHLDKTFKLNNNLLRYLFVNIT